MNGISLEQLTIELILYSFNIFIFWEDLILPKYKFGEIRIISELLVTKLNISKVFSERIFLALLYIISFILFFKYYII